MGDSKIRPWRDSAPFKCRSPQSVSSLEASFSKEDIKAVVFGLGGDRALRWFSHSTFFNIFGECWRMTCMCFYFLFYFYF